MDPAASDEASVRVSLSERADATIATVTIHNPKRLNALSSTVLDAFVTTLASLTRLPNLRCVIITGGPCLGRQQAFIGGADISELKTVPDAEAGRTFITKLHRACRALKDLPVPTIARVNGHALGGGMLIMTAADLRIVESTALFGMPEVQRGVPSTVDSALLPVQIGALRTRRLLLLGDLISAQQAESWGMVDKVVDGHLLDEAVEHWVSILLKAGPRALAAQKRLLNIWEQSQPQHGIEAGIWEFGRAFDGHDMESEGRRMMNEFDAQNKQRKIHKL